MEKKIKVIIKHPGSKPYSTWISPTLENLQKHVEGYIESVPMSCDAVILCNEEGIIRGMDFNCEINGLPLYGPIMFVGTSGAEFSDFPVEFADFKKMYPDLF